MYWLSVQKDRLDIEDRSDNNDEADVLYVISLIYIYIWSDFSL